jgi:hypothetical protein
MCRALGSIPSKEKETMKEKEVVGGRKRKKMKFISVT